MTISPRGVQKWVQERVQNDRHNLHAKHPCGFQATFPVQSLTEKIETGSAAGKLQFHVFAALAEFERGLIRERTRAGLEAARARGRSGGRKPKLDAKQIRHIKALLRDPKTCVAELARDYGVSRTTIYKHCGVVQPRHD